MATGVSFTNYLANALINHVLRNTAYTQPTQLRVRLWTTLPAEDGTGGVEVSGGGYAYQTATFGAASGSQASNSADIDFGTATANWGTIVGVTVGDQLGNFLFMGALTTSKTVNSGDGFKFLATKLICSLD